MAEQKKADATESRDIRTGLNVSVILTRFAPRDKNDNFRILHVQDEQGTSFGAKGLFGDIASGTRIVMYGEWGKPYKGSPQFECAAFERILPTSKEGIREYLASGVVAGCGPSLAKKIVAEFGEKTIWVLDNDPEQLLKIVGIGEKKKTRISESWKKQKADRKIAQYLFSIGVPIRYVSRIRRDLGEEAVSIIKENPYRLCEVEGIGFKTADMVALKNGFEKEGRFRLTYGIMYVLESACKRAGHTFITSQELTGKAAKELDVDRSLILDTMTELSLGGDIRIEDDAVYRDALYKNETSVARRLLRLKKSDPLPCSELSEEELEEETGMQYDEIQREAIAAAAQESVLVITGGPGTGKSTILKGIIAQFKASRLVVKLAAPTGKAAKRITELTGEEASTIHRMLYAADNRDDEEGLDADVVIIDETSMVDIGLMSWLTGYIWPGMRLIMIGDKDQLPSIGPGNVLKDVIESGVFRTICLEKTYRQENGSAIIEVAKKINAGDPCLTVGKNGVHFLRINGKKDKVENTILWLVKGFMGEKYGYSIEDIQVLSPYRKKDIPASVSELNPLIQDAVNPLGEKDITVHGLRVNDRVVNTRNNYKKDVLNGDTGTVMKIDNEDKTVTVDFDGYFVEYDFDELDDLDLCYATTIHKSQGSEYPVVILPVLWAHSFMLQRKILYTGVTRAKNLLVFVGDPGAAEEAIKNNESSKRNSRLRERLAGILPA